MSLSSDMSWALKQANQGRDAKQIARSLSEPPARKRPAGSTQYQRILRARGQDAAVQYATRTAEKAVAFVREHPKITDHAGAAMALVHIEAAADSLPWLPYCGPKARRALEAAFVVASRAGRVRIGLALREWAEIAGLDFDTIVTQRNVLQRAGWLHRDQNDVPGRTSRFTLRKPSHILSCQEIGMWDTADRAWLSRDAFREDALGSVGWLILRGVSAVPESRCLLQTKIGLDPDELWRYLLAFEKAGVCTVGDDSIRRTTDDLIPLLDKIAMEYGTAGELVRMQWKHKGDRQAFRRRAELNVGADHA